MDLVLDDNYEKDMEKMINDATTAVACATDVEYKEMKQKLINRMKADLFYAFDLGVYEGKDNAK